MLSRFEDLALFVTDMRFEKFSEPHHPLSVGKLRRSQLAKSAVVLPDSLRESSFAEGFQRR